MPLGLELRSCLAGRRWRVPKALLLFLAGMAVVWAATTFTDFLGALAQRESSMNPGSINSKTHYMGLFQMGEGALQDVGVYGGDGTQTNDWLGAWSGKYGATSKAAFLANPDAQIQAETAYLNKVWNSYLAPKGAASYLGQTINGITITQSGLVAAAHLVGQGKVLDWLASNGRIQPADGNGTRLTEYLQRFAGYSLSTTAPSYAAIRAASPTGGTTTILTPPTGSATQAPRVTAGPLFSLGGGAPSYATPAEGFAGATGYQMSDVSRFISRLVMAAAITWLAYTVLASWRGFASGAQALTAFKLNIMRATVMTLILTVLLW